MINNTTTSQNTLVSVIIPCYGQAHWLGDAIESALKQTHKPIEIIVVNDGSPDNTTEIASKYPVEILCKENGGLSSARNAGIAIATGEHILCLDADDMILPEMVEKCLARNDDIVSTAQQEFGDTNYLWDTQLEHPTFFDFWNHNQINCCSLFKRKIWEELGGFDESMRYGYEDWDFWMRATDKGYTVSVIKEPLFLYRRHGISMVHGARKHHNEIVRYMRQKYYGK